MACQSDLGSELVVIHRAPVGGGRDSSAARHQQKPASLLNDSPLDDSSLNDSALNESSAGAVGGPHSWLQPCLVCSGWTS